MQPSASKRLSQIGHHFVTEQKTSQVHTANVFGQGCTAGDNYINGQSVPPKNRKYLDIESPGNGAIIGKVAMSTAEDVHQAVQAASAAFKTWSKLPVKNRTQILFKMHALVRDNADKIADCIVLEHGKTKAEALGSVHKGNETLEYACSMPQLLPGRVLEVATGVECKEYKDPIGVVASIVPFNFPAMVPMWTLPIAIATGNTLILKPSEKVPLTLALMVALFKEAGLPDGVINIVNGGLSAVEAICDHPDIKAVTFVGSSKVAEIVAKRCRALNKKVLALGGAKNYLIALPDCHTDMTATDVMKSFAGCSGQRCMAASVLLVVGVGKGEKNALIDCVVEKASKLTPGQSKANDMGPVIDKAAVDRITHYIDLAEKNGAKILLDGRSWTKTQKQGYWVGPTVIEHTNPSDIHFNEEIFGPVLSIYRVKDKQEALEMENKVAYGNAACIYTSTGESAQWFASRMSAAMIGVNIGVPVPREPFSFGGMNASRFGDGDITGDAGIEFFTNRRKVTTKWTPPTNKSDWMS